MALPHFSRIPAGDPCLLFSSTSTKPALQPLAVPIQLYVWGIMPDLLCRRRDPVSVAALCPSERVCRHACDPSPRGRPCVPAVLRDAVAAVLGLALSRTCANILAL